MCERHGGAGFLDRAVRGRGLASRGTKLYLAGHLTLIVTLFAQVYKWVPADLMLLLKLVSHPV